MSKEIPASGSSVSATMINTESALDLEDNKDNNLNKFLMSQITPQINPKSNEKNASKFSIDRAYSKDLVVDYLYNSARVSLNLNLYFKILLPISINPAKLKDVFKFVVNSRQYVVIDEDENSYTAIYKPKCKILDCLKSLLKSFIQTQDSICALKFLLTIDEKACFRKIILIHLFVVYNY